MRSFDGKIVLITGGSSGIGLAAARRFHLEGARLVITGRDAASLERARAELGADTLAVQSDAADITQIKALLAQVQTRFGGIDVLFANAGIAKALPFEQTTAEAFDQVMNTNVRGVFFLLQEALPLLAKNASVIVTTSIANKKTVPNYSVYGASKAALASLVRTLAPMLIERGIRLNAISPGPTDTPMFGRSGLPDEVMQARKRDLAAKAPTKRLATADDVARVALFLASDAAAFVTGEEIIVDGAMSLV